MTFDELLVLRSGDKGRTISVDKLVGTVQVIEYTCQSFCEPVRK